ncbi:hypothetical protein LINGRAHAP2_LOCUS23222, partial [Linum grandiflorum]
PDSWSRLCNKSAEIPFRTSKVCPRATHFAKPSGVHYRFLVCFSKWEPPTPYAVAMLIHASYWIHLWDFPREY